MGYLLLPVVSGGDGEEVEETQSVYKVFMRRQNRRIEVVEMKSLNDGLV